MMYKPNEKLLSQLPARVVKLLSAIGTRENILVLMRQKGFEAADQAEGWTLLHNASGYEPQTVEAPASPGVQQAKAAEAELDDWDESNFRLIQAALSRRYPETLAYLFRGELEAKQGPEAVLSVKALLDRVEEIQQDKDPERDKTLRQKDQEALALLAKRGYPEAEWTRLRTLVTTATQPVEPTPIIKPRYTEEERQQALLELYAWYKEWSTVAHTVIHRRDYLILMGLAQRKSPKKAA